MRVGKKPLDESTPCGQALSMLCVRTQQTQLAREILEPLSGCLMISESICILWRRPFHCCYQLSTVLVTELLLDHQVETALRDATFKLLHSRVHASNREEL